jgi:hypothetical protein
VFADAIRFRLATQQDDSGAKFQVFFGDIAGVLLRWILVDVIQRRVPWMFGVILARLVVALIVTIFVFSGYWNQVKDEPPSMRFWNAMAYGITMDVIVSTWLPTPVFQ